MKFKQGKRLKDETINGTRVYFVRDSFGRVYASTENKSKFVVGNNKAETIEKVKKILNNRPNKKYEVIFDINNKPYSEYASNEDGLEKLIKKAYLKSQEDEDFDMQIFDGNKDITESQFVKEIIADVTDY